MNEIYLIKNILFKSLNWVKYVLLCIMNLTNLCASVNQMMIEVGEFIIKERLSFSKQMVSDKGLNQLVSYVDVQAEQQIVRHLSSILPNSGFITEEQTISQEKKEYNWIIDPLDGTTNFIHNLPIYSISVALEHQNEILIGVVYELGKKDLFSAWKGGGAWCNGVSIQVSDEQKMQNSLIATGFPYYDFDDLEAYIQTLKHLMKSSHGLRRMGSAAVDLAYVAAGKFEGFFEYGLNAWDVAAGCLLVEEAGGTVLDFKGQNDYIFGKSIIAGNNSIVEALLNTIQTNFKTK